jgi:hypothetical protein
MAAFKTFNSQDVIISPLKVSKNFRFEGASAFTASNVGIDRFLGTNGNFLTDKSLTGQVSQEYQVTVYNSAKQLYYTNYLSGSFGEVSNAVVPSFNPDGTITPPSGSSQTYNTLYDNFETTTLNPQKVFPTESIGIISIPTKLYGDYIKPNSFKIISPVSGTLYDDGEGRIKSGSNYVGNIIYEHGIVVLTNRSNIPTTTGEHIFDITVNNNTTSSFTSVNIFDGFSPPPGTDILILQPVPTGSSYTASLAITDFGSYFMQSRFTSAVGRVQYTASVSTDNNVLQVVSGSITSGGGFNTTTAYLIPNDNYLTASVVWTINPL